VNEKFKEMKKNGGSEKDTMDRTGFPRGPKLGGDSKGVGKGGCGHKEREKKEGGVQCAARKGNSPRESRLAQKKKNGGDNQKKNNGRGEGKKKRYPKRREDRGK